MPKEEQAVNEMNEPWEVGAALIPVMRRAGADFQRSKIRNNTTTSIPKVDLPIREVDSPIRDEEQGLTC